MRNNVFHLGKMSDTPVYFCNHSQFAPLLLIQAYGGQGYQGETVGHFIEQLILASNQGGLHLIQVPTSTSDDAQNEICTKVNTYIGFKNGVPDAIKAWHILREQHAKA
jgi:indolepyruvate decarboxylase